jgi:hypothetical protein
MELRTLSLHDIDWEATGWTKITIGVSVQTTEIQIGSLIVTSATEAHFC